MRVVSLCNIKLSHSDNEYQAKPLGKTEFNPFFYIHVNFSWKSGKGGMNYGFVKII